MSMKKFVYFIFLLLLPVLAWSQCMITPVTLQDRINNATVVVEATAIQQNSYWKQYNKTVTGTTATILSTLPLHFLFLQYIKAQFREVRLH